MKNIICWTRRSTAGIAILVTVGALIVGSGVASGAEGTTLDPALCAPDSNTFTLDITNPYFPALPGQNSVFSGREQGQIIGLQITVLDETENFKGERTRVVVETEWADDNGNFMIDEDEALIEVSRNYFAQTQDGTVCYFGEDVDIYENGEVVSHEGAWRADGKGNAPGIFMPAPSLIDVGVTFQQEIAPGVAEDEATIVATGVTVKLPAGTFEGSIKVRDFNPLDGSKGFKWYAPDVGLVIDGPLSLVSY